MFNLPLQVATEREIARQQYSLAGQALSDWTVRLKGFPHPALSTNNIVGQVIGPFLFAASMFSYVPVVRLLHHFLEADVNPLTMHNRQHLVRYQASITHKLKDGTMTFASSSS